MVLCVFMSSSPFPAIPTYRALSLYESENSILERNNPHSIHSTLIVSSLGLILAELVTAQDRLNGQKENARSQRASPGPTYPLYRIASQIHCSALSNHAGAAQLTARRCLPCQISLSLAPSLFIFCPSTSCGLFHALWRACFNLAPH